MVANSLESLKARIADMGIALNLCKRTTQTKCAYCGADFEASYGTSLTMDLDHVVPSSICALLNIPDEWREDCSKDGSA